MIVAGYILLFLFIAITADWLTVKWHTAREKLKVAKVIWLSMVIEVVNWAPIVVAIDDDVLSAKLIALINVAGTAIGSGGAVWRLKKTKTKRQITSKCKRHKGHRYEVNSRATKTRLRRLVYHTYRESDLHR